MGSTGVDPSFVMAFSGRCLAASRRTAAMLPGAAIVLPGAVVLERK